MNMNFYFNPLDKNCKEIRGGVREGQSFRLRLFCFAEEGAKEGAEEGGSAGFSSGGFLYGKTFAAPENNAYLLLCRDGEEKKSYPMTRAKYGWSASVTIAEKGLYFYSFYIENHGFFVRDTRKNGRLSPHDDGDFLLTVSTADYATPYWLKGGIMYQIFPDRFCRAESAAEANGGKTTPIEGRILRSDWGGTPSYKPDEHGKVLNNDFFGGNLNGIKSRLPYLKSLGVSVIYLNPVFEATSNHRYDTSDYMKIDPWLGTEDDLRALVNEAKTLNIRIILDGVFNHTGDNSVYFNKYGKYPSVGAYQSEDSPYFSWYTFQRFPDKYSCWWGIDILPEVNEQSEDYQNFIFGEYTKSGSAGQESGVLKKWLSFGIGGYRLDVADELPDFFLKKLRKCVKETDENAVIIGEVWEDASDKIAYSARREYLQGEELPDQKGSGLCLRA
ncbi:MAG: alpha-amylase family glycosyl hydrolase, partial [Candidatus Scatosoma sp.]